MSQKLSIFTKILTLNQYTCMQIRFLVAEIEIKLNVLSYFISTLDLLNLRDPTSLESLRQKMIHIFQAQLIGK